MARERPVLARGEWLRPGRSPGRWWATSAGWPVICMPRARELLGEEARMPGRLGQMLDTRIRLVVHPGWHLPGLPALTLRAARPPLMDPEVIIAGSHHPLSTHALDLAAEALGEEQELRVQVRVERRTAPGRLWLEARRAAREGRVWLEQLLGVH